MKGMKENAYKCLFNGGCPGLGYDIDESQHYVINENEAKAVMLIFSMYLCDYTYQQIADALNADGFLTKIGKPFTRNSFIEILRNEKYTGVYVFNRSEAKGYDNKRNSHRNKPPEEIIRIEGGMPAIISRETWEAAQEKRISHMHHARHCNCVYLLSRLVVCGVCGKMMHGTIRLRNNLPTYHTYTCGTKKAECDNPKAIEKNSLEQYVIALVEKKCITYAEPLLQASFLSLGRDSLEFRTLLQRFIDRIEVFPEKVIVKLYVNGKVKSFRRERRAFKTPSQRCFKDKI
jgi:site-specific DNA recombinase